MRIAIVGTGISGLACAHYLSRRHEVVVFEADERPGGHTHTHHLDLADGPVDVDTGFLVYNERTYPLFCRFLDHLGVATQPGDMSFSVADKLSGTEWRGTSPATVFARPSNALRPGFWAMLRDIARFNRAARRLLSSPPSDSYTLADMLEGHRWSRTFVDWYLVPIGSSIWSASPATVTSMPAATFARFFERHGLLRTFDQPSWRTVSGGARRYVDAVLGPLVSEGRLRLGTPVDKLRRHDGYVEVVSRHGPENFDHVVVATHSDQALAMLSDADRLERDLLGAIAYQPNVATLHTDARLMPRARRAWASWNYRRCHPEAERATLTYWLNSLQGLTTATHLLVTLNQADEIDPSKVIAQMDYSHPVMSSKAVTAQRQWSQLNGRRRTWFCGAYWGYGFHEDGVRSAVQTCERLGVVP